MQSLPRIAKLEEGLANQIAAGEVVERPAAALKELVENSLDAGATEIRVEIKEGGVKLLEISDNGFGIHPEDLVLALGRHATSKIQKTEDLFAIKSWGFRGEALASIAAVSRMTLSSRREAFSTGKEIRTEGVQVLQENALARPVGTTVRIEDLFFNTPARLKFLKSQAAETSACVQTLYRLALGSPGVGFELWLEGKKEFSFAPSANPEQRILEVFKEAFSYTLDPSELIPFSKEKPDAKVHGFLLPASYNIPSTRGIFCFVNGRSVKDKLLQQAILAAAKEVLFGHVYPQIILYLETAPENVDVNVHPTKAELRFRNSSQIFGLVRSTVEQTLALDRNASIAKQGTENIVQRGATGLVAHLPQNFALPLETATFFHQKQIYKPLVETSHDNPQTSSPMAQAVAAKKGPQFLGTLKNTYLVCQEDSGLLLVDQHAAHERITYERLRESQLRGSPSAPMLIPLVVEVPARALDLLEAELERLAVFGLRMHRSGPSQISVQEIPTLLLTKDGSPRIAIGALVRKLCSHLEEEKGHDLEDQVLTILLETLASQSCHGSVRAGQSLSELEARALLEQMSETDFSGHCPHGRPTTIRLSWQEIERMFKRIV